MFGNSLDNLGKSTGECKNKQSDKFPNFLKIFENLRKSSEVFGRLRKSSEKIGNLSQSAQNNFAAVLIFKIFENCRKSSEKFGKCQKVLKTIFRHFLKIVENFRKCSEVFGNTRKTSETLGKFSFYNIPISDTCGLKIRFKNFDL